MSEQDLFVFRWPVAVGGYKWVKRRVNISKEAFEYWDSEFGDPPPGYSSMEVKGPEWLVPTAPLKKIEQKVTWPLDVESALFIKFSEIKQPKAQEAIVEFANEHGTLFPFFADKENIDLFNVWSSEIATMRLAIRIRLNFANKRKSSLYKLIKWDGKKHVKVKPNQELRKELGAIPQCRVHTNPSTWKRLNELDVEMRPAAAWLGGIVNERLQKNTAASVLWYDREEHFTTRIIPHNLLGALWIQFSQALSENRKYKRCKECQAWWEESLNKSRKTRRYCSDACKQKAYRKRLKK